MSASVSVHERSVWIVEYLRQAEEREQCTIRAIWEAARLPKGEGGSGGIDDSASLPTYHRTIAKLLREGQVEEDETTVDGSAVFKAAEQLSPLNTYTLTDLNQALWEMSAPEALALYLEAVDYYEDRSEEVLGKAAVKLMDEDPRELVLSMLRDLVTEIEEDRDILMDPKAAEPVHQKVLEGRLEGLRRFLYSEIGISATVWDLPTDEEVGRGERVQPLDWDTVKNAVAERIFGDAFIQEVTPDQSNESHSRIVVAGTDGSSHAGYVRGVPAPQYVEEEGRLILTFNNSVAYVEMPEDFPYRVASPYHGVPMTRAALEDPHNRGMIVSRPWFPDLTDSEFEHMQKAALDVVQFRVDERLINGVARAYGTAAASGDSGLLPKPNVLIRDGTVTPQEREFQHYTTQNAYGDIVREGIALSYSILRSVRDSQSRIYAGAVKSTQLRTFSRIINWYIKKYIDQGWDLSRVSHVTDNVAVTKLLGMTPTTTSKTYYRTCIIVRPFWALDTNFRQRRINDTPEDWLKEFIRRRDAQERDWNEHGGEHPPHLLGVDVEDDPFVRMCQETDYASFYFGHSTDGRPELILPRFEFMDALRRLSLQKRVQRVIQTANSIIAGVHDTKWSLDREHNFMSNRKMPRMIPYVLYEAHEKCKTLGHKLELELRQAITMRLSQLKRLRGLPIPKVLVEPMPVKEYLSSLQKKLLGQGSEESSDREE